MNSIVLRSGGLYAKEYDESTNHISHVKITGPISLYLQSAIEIEKGVVVQSLMEVLMQHEADIDVMFFGFSKGHKIRPFYEEMKKTPEIKRLDLSVVEIGWTADYFAADRVGQHNELHLSVQMSGIAKKKVDGETAYISVSQTAMNDWKHVPVVLCDTLRVSDFRVVDKGPTGRTETHFVTLLEAKKEMTLYDLIGGFIDSITWYGYPEQRQERMEDIERMVLGSGGCTDREMLEDKQDELAKALLEENYERAAVLQKEIENIKKLLNDS